MVTFSDAQIKRVLEVLAESKVWDALSVVRAQLHGVSNADSGRIAVQLEELADKYATKVGD